MATTGHSGAETLESIANPKHANNSWVSDMAHVLDGNTERRINALLDGLERRTSAEMAVVTIRRTDGSTPKQFATRLFNRWGIGKRDRDNGVLMLLVMDDRRIEVETGRGMASVLPDNRVQVILAESVVPHFRDDDYAGGVYTGAQALTQIIERAEAHSGMPGRVSPKKPPQRSLATAKVLSGASRVEVAQRPANNSSDGFDDSTYGNRMPAHSPMPWWALGGGALLLPVGGWLALRSRVRHCPQCRAAMRRLDEKQDDIYLAFDQQFEENLGSVDYRVWRCDACQTTTLERAAKWFSGYEDCPQCRHRTLAVQNTILRHPTYTQTGESLTTRTCRFPNCGFRDQQQQMLPVKPPPSQTQHHNHSSSSHSSSASSSSSSDFGGGSSSGGGAGASW